MNTEQEDLNPFHIARQQLDRAVQCLPDFKKGLIDFLKSPGPVEIPDGVPELYYLFYTTAQVGWHYVKLVLAMTSFGMLGGIGLGAWFAKGLGVVYRAFYSFPYLEYRLEPWIITSAVVVTLFAALVGTIVAVRRAASVPPAEGMRPEPPPAYRRTPPDRCEITF